MNHAAVACAALAIVEVEANVPAIFCLPKKLDSLASLSYLLPFTLASFATFVKAFLSLLPLVASISVLHRR